MFIRLWSLKLTILEVRAGRSSHNFNRKRNERGKYLPQSVRLWVRNTPEAVTGPWKKHETEQTPAKKFKQNHQNQLGVRACVSPIFVKFSKTFRFLSSNQTMVWVFPSTENDVTLSWPYWHKPNCLASLTKTASLFWTKGGSITRQKYCNTHALYREIKVHFCCD